MTWEINARAEKKSHTKAFCLFCFIQEHLCFPLKWKRAPFFRIRLFLCHKNLTLFNKSLTWIIHCYGCFLRKCTNVLLWLVVLPYPKHMCTFCTQFRHHRHLHFMRNYNFYSGFFDDLVQSRTWQFEFNAQTNSQHNSFALIKIHNNVICWIRNAIKSKSLQILKMKNTKWM